MNTSANCRVQTSMNKHETTAWGQLQMNTSVDFSKSLKGCMAKEDQLGLCVRLSLVRNDKELSWHNRNDVASSYWLIRRWCI